MRLWQKRQGQSLVELLLLLILIFIIVVVLLTLLGDQVGEMYRKVIRLWRQNEETGTLSSLQWQQSIVRQYQGPRSQEMQAV